MCSLGLISQMKRESGSGAASACSNTIRYIVSSFSVETPHITLGLSSSSLASGVRCTVPLNAAELISLSDLSGSWLCAIHLFLKFAIKGYSEGCKPKNENVLCHETPDFTCINPLHVPGVNVNLWLCASELQNILTNKQLSFFFICFLCQDNGNKKKTIRGSMILSVMIILGWPHTNTRPVEKERHFSKDQNPQGKNK